MDGCRELETLQDRVQPRPVAHIHAVIEQELGCAASDAYAAFEEDAKAAASLAQVPSNRRPAGTASMVTHLRSSTGTLCKCNLPWIELALLGHAAASPKLPPPAAAGTEVG